MSAVAHPDSDRLADTLIEAGVTLAAYLPDSVLIHVTGRLEKADAVTTIVCSREDEGAAIAAGSALAGGLPVLLLEGSGVGYCGLLLARAQLMRAGMLIIASHSPALGEKFDYHGASRMVGAGVLGGLGIPYVIPATTDELMVAVEQALVTVRGQRASVGILVPPHLLDAR